MEVEQLAKTGDQWTFHRFHDTLQKLCLAPKKLIHVGANLGQEVPDYRRTGIEQIVLVEPDPQVCAKLHELYPEPDVTVIEAAVADQEGVGRFQRAPEGADVWSTLRQDPLPRNARVGTFIDVRLVRLRDIQGDAEVAVIDTQGTELDALKSADLSRLSLVVVETQEDRPSGHAGWWPDVLAFMQGQDWEPVHQWRHEHNNSKWFATYSDSFFMPRR